MGVASTAPERPTANADSPARLLVGGALPAGEQGCVPAGVTARPPESGRTVSGSQKR